MGRADQGGARNGGSMSLMIGENPAADIHWLEGLQRQRPLSAEEAGLLVNLYLLIDDIDHARQLNASFSARYPEAREFERLRLRMAFLEDPVAALDEAAHGLRNSHLQLVDYADLLDLGGRHAQSLRLLSERLAQPAPLADTVALFNRLAFSALNSPTLDHGVWRPEFEALVNRHYPAVSSFRASQPPGNPNLRIGFIGSNFHYHPMANFISPIFRGLREASADFVVFSNGKFRDVYQQRLRELAPEWHDVSGLDDATLHDLLCRQRLSVLIDLDNHTRCNRMAVIAARAAPIQASLYGLNLTTGLSAMDYRICDANTDPLSLAAQFSERALRLPVTHLAYDALTPVPVRTVRVGRVRIGVFNSWHKICAAQIDLYARLLHALPRVELVLVGFDDGVARHVLLQRLKRQRADLERVEIHSFVEQASFFRLAQSVDFALDSWPWGGGATTAALLNLGVPVVCWNGSRPSSRVGSAMMELIDRADWTVNELCELFPKVLEKVEVLQAVRADGPALQQDFYHWFGQNASGRRLYEALAGIQ